MGQYLPVGTLLRGETYRIVRFISSGGFGCTYEAEHIMLEKRVAIKEFFVKDFCNRDGSTSRVTTGIESKQALVGKLRRKFIDEAKALCKLQHPGIVSVSDVFEENGTAYYVMEFVEGCSLADRVNTSGPIPEKEALRYIRQVAEALAYVHGRNRLHLDLKPGNIMIDASDRAVLIDFGASKQYDEEAGENTSTLLGKTPGYAPPEQMSNNVVKFLPATDIYALGATLYKLLTGITPPDALQRISGEGVEPLPAAISAATRATVEAALVMDKNSRLQSAAAFLQLLEGPSAAAPSEDTVLESEDTVFDEPREALVPPQTPELTPTVKRPWGKWIVAACLIAAVSVGLLLFRPRATEPEDTVAAVDSLQQDSVELLAEEQRKKEEVELQLLEEQRKKEEAAAEQPRSDDSQKSDEFAAALQRQQILKLADDDIISFKEGGKWGFKVKSTCIYKHLRDMILVAPKYDYIYSYNEGLIGVKLNDKWGFVDKTGREIIPLKYDGVGSFYEGLAEVKLNGKWGFIDKTGKEVIPFKYDSTGFFSEGLAEVKLNGKRGFIDKTGKEVIPLKYDDVWPFREGRATVRLNGESFEIDKNGNRVD